MSLPEGLRVQPLLKRCDVDRQPRHYTKEHCIQKGPGSGRGQHPSRAQVTDANIWLPQQVGDTPPPSVLPSASKGLSPGAAEADS